MISCATRRPYADQDNALHQVAKLVVNGSDAVDLSLMTVLKVAYQTHTISSKTNFKLTTISRTYINII